MDQFDDLAALEAIRARMVIDLRIELETIETRERKLFDDVRACAIEKDVTVRRIAVLEQAGQMVGSAFPPLEADAKAETDFLLGEVCSSLDEGSGQRRARIGDQRYAMMKAIQRYEASPEPVCAEHVIELTGYEPRRVRDQLAADVRTGYLEASAGGFRISMAGDALIESFEVSRQTRGKSLPVLPERLQISIEAETRLSASIHTLTLQFREMNSAEDEI